VVNNIFFQYYSLLIFIVCAVVMVVVSRMTGGSKKDLSGLTYGTLSDEHRNESRSSWNARDVIASVVVLMLILAAYLYFTG
jgi:SSS family solute:Na+ symporter